MTFSDRLLQGSEIIPSASLVTRTERHGHGILDRYPDGSSAAPDYSLSIFTLLSLLPTMDPCRLPKADVNIHQTSG